MYDNVAFFITSDFSIWTIILIIYLFFDMFAVFHILKTKHGNPASTILWLFVVYEFSIYGVLIYLFLGINRVKKHGKAVSRFNRKMDQTRSIKCDFFNYLNDISKFIYRHPYPKQTASYISVFERFFPDREFYTGNNVSLLVEGVEAYPEMIKAINSAKKHVHLTSFIIMNDSTGEELMNILAKKAEEGVKVKVLFDRVGSSKAYKSHFFKRFTKSENLQVKVFSKLNILVPYRIQLRNHRKLLIVDGKTAFIGGINISSENNRNICKNKYIHDLHCMVRGPIVGEMQYVFLRDWSFVTNSEPLQLIVDGDYFNVPEKCGETLMRIVASGPGQSDNGSRKMFLTAAASAESSLYIITPYFIPDSGFITALCMASARGVDVRIIIPENNNKWYVRYAAKSMYDNLLIHRVRIFEKKGVFSHAKAMMVDKKWVAMGSSNCDYRSFMLDYELDIVCEGGAFIEDVHYQFLEELRESEEIILSERMRKGIVEELLENFCYLLAPML